jgi:hypothetical protein
VVQAKSDLFNKNTNDAVMELTEAVSLLELTTPRGRKEVAPNAQVKKLVGKIRELRLELSLGREVSATKLEEIQK